MRVAQVFHIALSEIQSSLLYWTVPDPVPAASPKLQKFLIAREGEADWPSRRLEDDDPIYMLHLAFRIDSLRIPWDGHLRSARGMDLIYGNLTSKLYEFLGVEGTVHNIKPANFMDLKSSSLRREAGVGDRSEFQPVYQFNVPGIQPNEGPAGLSLSGIPLSDQTYGCLHKCFAFNEHGDTHGTCKSDCECNSARWCSNLGMCTGQSRGCLSDDNPTSTITSATATTTPEATWAPLPATETMTTSQNPMGALSNVECHGKIDSIWRSCGALEQAWCPAAACDLLLEVVNEPTIRTPCMDDLCLGTFQHWQLKCGDTITGANETFSFERMRWCGLLPATVTTTTTTFRSEGSVSMIFIGIVLSCVGAMVCCCMVCLAKSFSYYGSDHPLFHCVLWCCSKCTSRFAQSRAGHKNGTKAKMDRKVTVGPRRASQEPEETRPPSPWFSAVLHRMPSIPGLPGTGKTAPDEPPPAQDAKPARKKKSPQKSTSTNTTDSARQAWSDGPTKGSGSCGNGSEGSSPSSGRAAATGPPPATCIPTTESEILIAEMRKLRKLDHSADERKRFYREQLLKWHPDKNIGNEEHAAEMFRVLQENKGWFLNEDAA